MFFDQRRGLGLRSDCKAPATGDASCDLQLTRTDNSGATWKPVGARTHVEYPEWRGYPFVHLLTTNGVDAWIYGNRTFVTHDAGSTFSEEPLHGIVADMKISGSSVWAVVRPCKPVEGCASSVFAADLQGGVWKRQPTAPEFGYPYIDLIRTTPNDAVLIPGSGTTAAATRDGGSKWNTFTLPSACAVVHRLATVDAKRLFALCGEASPTMEQRKQLYRSDNGGKSWTVLADTDPQANNHSVGRLPRHGLIRLFTLVSIQRMWLALSPDGFITSPDGGTNWQPVALTPTPPPPNFQTVDAFFFLDPNRGWAWSFTGCPGICAAIPPNMQNILYRTTDGRNWTPTNETPG